MARLAVQRGVGTNEWKAIVVLLDLLHRHLPSAHRMALLAICAKLSPMDICVTVLAPLSDTREYWFYVALRAGHRRMHPAKRIFRLVVIEFRNGANRLPRIRSVAILTGDIQVPVRTVRARGVLRYRSYPGPHQETDRDYLEYTPSPHELAPCLRS